MADKGSGLRGAEGGAGRVHAAWGPRMRFAAGSGLRPGDASFCSMALGALGQGIGLGALGGRSKEKSLMLLAHLWESTPVLGLRRIQLGFYPECVTLGQFQLVFRSVSVCELIDPGPLRMDVVLGFYSAGFSPVFAGVKR